MRRGSRPPSTSTVTSVKELSGQICQICGDEIEITVDGEPFVACNECAFPVCRPCYEYERREGNQACPQCKTRYKCIKGSPRVEGDKEEDEFDDLDHEFDYEANDQRDPQQIVEAVLSAHLNTGRGSQANGSGLSTPLDMESSFLNPEIPLLTYGQEDAGISYDKHALIIPPFILCHLLTPPCHCHHDLWILRKIWYCCVEGQNRGVGEKAE